MHGFYCDCVAACRHLRHAPASELFQLAGRTREPKIVTDTNISLAK
jgi:hypothetical protein